MSAETLVENDTAPLKIKSSSQKFLALEDIKQGLKKWRISWMLAYQDIKVRYRRSVLGPFWLTLSMAITVYSMGYLYSHLFHMNLEIYFPYLVAGMLGWTLISTPLSEFTDAFAASEGLIKQIKLPYSLYIHRIIMRNLIIFFHNIIVIIPILLIFHQTAKINFHTLLLFPALAILYFNSITYGLILAVIGSRYRDISQIIKSLINVIMYLTPVMWNPIVLPAKDQFIIQLNPFYAFVELLRAPLIGQPIMGWTIKMVALISLIGLITCLSLFPRYRARIIYWL